MPLPDHLVCRNQKHNRITVPSADHECRFRICRQVHVVPAHWLQPLFQDGGQKPLGGTVKEKCGRAQRRQSEGEKRFLNANPDQAGLEPQEHALASFQRPEESTRAPAGSRLAGLQVDGRGTPVRKQAVPAGPRGGLDSEPGERARHRQPGLRARRHGNTARVRKLPSNPKV